MLPRLKAQAGRGWLLEVATRRRCCRKAAAFLSRVALATDRPKAQPALCCDDGGWLEFCRAS